MWKSRICRALSVVVILCMVNIRIFILRRAASRVMDVNKFFEYQHIPPISPLTEAVLAIISTRIAHLAVQCARPSCPKGCESEKCMFRMNFIAANFITLFGPKATKEIRHEQYGRHTRFTRTTSGFIRARCPYGTLHHRGHSGQRMVPYAPSSSNATNSKRGSTATL